MKALHEGWLAVMLACALVCATEGTARAQSCGDPDGADGVTVIDAANVLRQAVGLPSNCAGRLEFCDVDGVGGVTVIDAASVLRRAVGLPGANACVLANKQVEKVIGEGVKPLLLTLGIGVIPGQTARAADVTQCPDFGFVDLTADTATFLDCGFDDVINGSITTVVLNGSITSTSSSSIAFDLTVQDLSSQATLRFTGSLTASRNGDINGSIAVSSSAFGNFALVFQDLSLSISPSGTPISGSLVLEVDSSIFGGITSIKVVFDGTEIASVLATFDNQTTQEFLFNVTTGDLTLK